MRTVVSILDLYARRNLLRVLAVLAVMAGLQYGCYMAHFSSHREQGLGGLEIPFIIINFAAVVVISFFLCGRPSKASNREYAVRMLKISDVGIFFLDALFNMLMFIIVWAVQAAVILICLNMFSKSDWYVYGPQGMPVWVYSLSSLNWNIPMEHTVYWLEHLLTLISLSFACASARVILRRKRVSISFLLTLVLFLLIGLRNYGSGKNFIIALLCFVCAVACVISASWSLKGAKRPEVDDNV